MSKTYRWNSFSRSLSIFVRLCFFLVAITQSLVIVCCKSKHASPSFTPINSSLYHSSDRLLEQVKALSQRHSGNLNVETYETGNKGYRANVTVVTYCQNRKKIRDRSMFRILLSFGQHGRELITSELALAILSILSGEHSLPHFDPLFLKGILDKLVVKVVPIENLNGRKLVEAGDSCERRNGRGVDLNRNWSVDWGRKEKDYDPYEENPGTSPFSEPEAQIMRKMAISFKPHIWVNVHSGMEALFMPYDHKNSTPDGLPFQKMKFLLDEINTLHCHNRCVVGSGGGSVGYLAHGTATDYMYDAVKVPMAFTFEIYGGESASANDCFKMFNPTDLVSFNGVINDWCGAFLTLFSAGSSLTQWSKEDVPVVKWESMDEYLDGYLIERSSRYGKKKELLELGMQEMRTYFRLFLLSSILLIFMFCTRISKSKWNRPVDI